MTADLGHAVAPDLHPLVGAGVMSVDSGGLITVWTAQAERTFGWRRGEVIGHPLVATVAAPHERQRHERQLERVLSGEASGSELGVDLHARHHDGAEFTTPVTLVPVPLGRGYEFSAFLDAIESREWSEDELRRLHVHHGGVVDAALAAMRGDHFEHGGQVAGVLVIFRPVETASAPEPIDDPAPAPLEEPALPARSESTPGPVTSDLLRSALESDGFTISCQPVMDLRTNEVGHFELLLRMTDADGRLVLPPAFSGVAEREGLTRAIDRWMVRRAIVLLAEQQHQGRYVRVELSLSPDAVDDSELAFAIEQELAATGADPSRLVLGLNEDVVAFAVDQAAALATRLKGIGCKFALRDFGSSFAAMRHLKQLSIDYLKLDGGLISTFADSRTDQLVLAAVVDVAQGIGADTVAELVSDERTLVLLRQAGVSYAQGYQVGPPRRVSEAWSTSVP